MKKILFAFLAGLLVSPVLAEAPKSLNIYLNERPYAGKAIWYKNEVYVPLADMVRNLGGTFAFNHTTGEMHINLGAVPPAGPTRGTAPGGQAPGPMQAGGGGEPLVQAAFEHQLLYADNAKVSAVFRNNGDGVAHNVDVMCVFHDQMNHIIGTSVRFLGTLVPGESRSAEFWLFDPQSNDVASGYAGYPDFVSGSSVNLNQSPLSTVDVGTYRTQVQYEFKVNYR